MKRRTVIGGLGVLGAGVAAGLYRFTDLLVKHYPPTPYDDVLTQLVDRENAAALGRHVVGNFDLPREAAALRARLSNTSLEAVAAHDAATGQMMEVDGWVVPQIVARMSALAARV